MGLFDLFKSNGNKNDIKNDIIQFNDSQNTIIDSIEKIFDFDIDNLELDEKWFTNFAGGTTTKLYKVPSISKECEIFNSLTIARHESGGVNYIFESDFSNSNLNKYKKLIETLFKILSNTSTISGESFSNWNWQIESGILNDDFFDLVWEPVNLKFSLLTVGKSLDRFTLTIHGYCPSEIKILNVVEDKQSESNFKIAKKSALEELKKLEEEHKKELYLNYKGIDESGNYIFHISEELIFESEEVNKIDDIKVITTDIIPSDGGFEFEIYPEAFPVRWNRKVLKSEADEMVESFIEKLEFEGNIHITKSHDIGKYLDEEKSCYKYEIRAFFGVKSEYVQKKSRKITQSVKDSVWRRDGGSCVECGSNENLEFDHIIPFSKGGANTYRNIQLLCEKCNRTKSDKIG